MTRDERGATMKIRVKSWKEVEHLFPKETGWRVEIAEIPECFRYYRADSSQESDYCICHSLPRRETEGKNRGRIVNIHAVASSKNNSLVFEVWGPKRLISERENEIDKAKSIISAIVLEVAAEKWNRREAHQ